MKNKIFNSIFIALTLFLTAVFLLLILSLFWGLKDNHSVSRLNFNEIFYAVKLSVFTATVSAVIAFLFSIPVSYYLARHDFPGKFFIDTLFDLTIVLSPVAVGAMILIFFNTPFGKMIENNITGFVFEIRGIILAQFFIIIGFSVKFLKNVFENVDQEYENIARTLGANSFRVFTTITLPLSLKGIISTLLLIWAKAISEFGASITVAGAMTMKTETLPIAIFLSFENVDIYNAVVLILILITISLTILLVIKKILHWKRII
ncbi:MAG: ABC transporter permease [Spirochaetes bacterium]|nr:ABC transporter permease [Spirochaetota bacterium]